MENESNSMAELLKEYDVKRIKAGEILKGKVIDVTDKEVMVNIDYAFDGMITKEELTNDLRDPREVLNVGDEIEVYVLSPNDGEGYVLLSRIKALAVTEKKDIEKAYKNKETITVFVKEEVKGGVVAYYGSIRVFIPASQCSKDRIELKTLLNKNLEVKIIELNFKDRKIVASRRIIEEDIYNKKQEEIWKTIKPGEKREGTVTRLAKFGAFVDIGGVEGLIHINDLSWQRVKKVSDVVSEGDKVQVFVGDVDAKNRKMSLILKDVNNEPWTLYGDSLKEGAIIDGKVVRLTNFGAFVEVFEGIEGLVHITEISDENIAKASDVLSVGQKVKVKVLNVDKEAKKLSLSIKEAVEKSNEYLKYNDDEESGTSLADLFKNLEI